MCRLESVETVLDVAAVHANCGFECLAHVFFIAGAVKRMIHCGERVSHCYKVSPPREA